MGFIVVEIVDGSLRVDHDGMHDRGFLRLPVPFGGQVDDVGLVDVGAEHAARNRQHEFVGVPVLDDGEVLVRERFDARRDEDGKAGEREEHEERPCDQQPVEVSESGSRRPQCEIVDVGTRVRHGAPDREEESFEHGRSLACVARSAKQRLRVLPSHRRE